MDTQYTSRFYNQSLAMSINVPTKWLMHEYFVYVCFDVFLMCILRFLHGLTLKWDLL